jgi:hypothetical protein
MNILLIRRWLALSLVFLGIAGFWFYQRQNVGMQIGGAISLPKMLWLTYALAVWFVLPFFLWRDARLDSSVRRLFGVFWIAMMIRGILELVLLYAVVHWHPVYGISHDVFCLLLVLVLRRGCSPTDPTSRRALRFSGSIVVSLAAEIAFAGMFLQTGTHESGVYFASTAASWGYVNFVTTVSLLFFYPDLLAALAGLYFPGFDSESPRGARWTRSAAGLLTVVLTTTALVIWTHMMRTEREAERFKKVGYEIVDSCADFKNAFVNGEEAEMADFITAGNAAWRLAADPDRQSFELRRWLADGRSKPLLQAIIEWRGSFAQVAQAAFKIHLLEEVLSDREAVAQIRFEVTGKHRTDSGLIRCRFQVGEDKRWRVVESSLIEGTSVTGPGNHFVDLAAKRGIDFKMDPDRRFLPGDKCEGHVCPGPTKLKFQTMRHAYAGAAAADFDGDGHDDVFLCAGGQPALYRNRGDGTFENYTEIAGLRDLWHITTAGFADLDNDGDQDLFLGAFYGPNYLFSNNGDGTFSDVTASSGLEKDDAVTCFCFFDYDNDGKLDLYLGRFLDAQYEIPDSFLYARNGQPNILYRNDGNLHFNNVTEQAGVGDRGLTLSLAAADYDRDGDQDLYVANDFGRNVLYQNQGDGTFRDVAKATGTLAIGGSMSASWGDYNNDGRLDLYVGALRSNQRWFVQPLTARRVFFKFIREGRFLSKNPVFQDLRFNMGDDWVNIGNHALAGNSLLRQNQDGTFTDQAEAAGARPAGWYWSCGFLDIDNDGDLDIYATDGWITGEDAYDL